MLFISKLKIHQKLWMLTIGVILVLSVGYYFYFRTTVEQQFREGLLKKGMGLIQTTAVNLGGSIHSNDTKSLRYILQGLEKDTDISFIYVTDASQKMKYGFRYGTRMKPIKSFLHSNKIQKYEHNQLMLKQSIFHQDQYQGDIIVGFSLKWVKMKVAEQTRYLILINIILAVLGILFASLLARAISMPIKEAVKHINQYSEREKIPNLRLPVNGKDEISQLSSALNELADNLDKNIGELNESKKYLETIFQLSPVPVIISDTMGKIEGVNESASNFFGIESSVLMKMNLERFFQGDDLNVIINRIIQDMEDIRDFVTTIKMADGSKKVVELNIASHQDDLNYVKNIIIAIIDITEKIQIQREILSNQTKLQRINDELTHKTTELQRLSAWNKKNANNLAQLINLSQQMMRASTPKEITHKMIEGGRRLLEAEESFIYLWEAESKQLLPSMAAPVKILDRLEITTEGQQNFIWKTYHNNDAFVHDSEDLTQEEFDLIGIDNQEEFSIVSVPISERDYRFGVILFLRYKRAGFRVEDVHLVTTLANQAAILLDNMHLVHALQEKATSLEKAYGDLQQSQQQVIQLQKMESLGTLVGGIAHDFNNILGIIIPNTDLLRKDANGDARILRRAGIIGGAAQRAADLTRQLLMFSRNQDVQLKLINPNHFISRLANMLKRTLGKEYNIKIELDPNIGHIKADETRLTQVLINLAVNSRDAMPGGGDLLLRTSMRAYKPRTAERGTEKEFTCICISDRGSGIKSDDLDKIFDPFFTTKTVGKGTGLGLSVVYGIVKSHKGYVEVESEEGKGTTFYLYLPPYFQKLPEKTKTKMVRSPEGSEHILVVDDEKMIQDSVREILASFGYSVTTARHGMEALRLIKDNPNKFQLAIVDMSMPKMNGIETIRRIRQLDKSIKVILSSGHLAREKKYPANLKLDGLLPKPYRMRQLALQVREILNHRVKTPA